MKKLIIGIVIIILAVATVSYFRAGTDTATPSSRTDDSTEDSAPVSETVKVSSQTSEYQNAELGFSVKYPTVWDKVEADLGVSFVVPIDKTQVSTVAKLQADINVFAGKCSFPPVTTIKDRGTIKVGDNTLNTISMTNLVQGRSYFNRMYSLQKDSVCYMFSFSSIALDPASKGLTGSNITQAQNNNKAIVNSTDAAFTDVVKSFAFITGPQGKDETSVAPAK